MDKKTLTEQQLAKLKEPLPPDAIKPHPTKTYLSSIKAIYVVERLNEVFGLGGWFTTNEVVREEGKMIVVKSTFNAPEYGIMIPDIFGGNDNPDLGDAYKGACTDALTKIGSYLYIGMDVYKGLTEAKKEVKPAPVKKVVPTEKAFTTLIGRIEKGEKELIEKAVQTYSLTTDQYNKLMTLKQTA